ncbi:hypothetical protein [Polyangium jinanense]|uniref:Right handed beta helix domain-containing protein n=1 Tax=Polyangium jinanense TaxID=2829994 RepID=A0A9X4ARX6_9BACT|nr:hypothetical protein [Polyangium jinanense]MDC3980525.1 hypothetical protein [Polyangium jinanense]
MTPPVGSGGAGGQGGEGGGQGGEGGGQGGEGGGQGGEGGGQGGEGGGQGGEGGGQGGACPDPTCRADQACVAGECEFTCDGVSVPGDYATIQSAVSALEQLGGTICVKPGTYTEDVTIDNLHTSLLTIRGAAADKVTLQGHVKVGAGLTPDGEGLVFEGITVTDGLRVTAYPPVVIRACTLQGMTTPGLDIVIVQSAVHETVTVDGCDISSAQQGALRVQSDGTTGMGVVAKVTNSYLHDSAIGAEIVATTCCSNSGKVTRVSLTNNTITNNGTGINTYFFLQTLELGYFNNLIRGNDVGVDLYAGTAATFGNNALSGNTTNYAGSAVPGPGYVTADPLLTASVPPAPGEGSPLLDKADPAKAPPLDFWAKPRTNPDIGAVER